MRNWGTPSESVMSDWAQKLLHVPDDWFGPAWAHRTHACVLTWADRGDDLLAESNYRSMLAELQSTAASQEYAGQDTGWWVIDASTGHWLVGSVRELFVQVYENPEDPTSGYTPVFALAVSLLEALQDYPILDESDFSDREWEARQSDFADALHHAMCGWDDSDDVRQAVVKAIQDVESDGSGRYDSGDGFATVNWERIEQDAIEARAKIYEDHARPYLDALAQGDPAMPGQLLLIDYP